MCHSSQNRLLLLDPGARALLEHVQHREELLVFEEAYGPDGVFDPGLALAAYDRLHAPTPETNDED